MFYLCVGKCTVCMLVPVKARRGYKMLETRVNPCKPQVDAGNQVYILLTTDPSSLQPH